MTRREFSLLVKRAAYARSGGICECGCGQPFTDHPKERPVYDHRTPDALGGAPTLDNCECIRKACHDVRTFAKGGDITKIAKAKRGERDRRGQAAPSRNPFPGSKGSRLKRKVNGAVVDRNTGEPA